MCGEEFGFKKNKYLYFTSLSPKDVTSLFSQGVCVDKCPTLVSGGDGTVAPVYDPPTVPCDDKYKVKCTSE